MSEKLLNTTDTDIDIHDAVKRYMHQIGQYKLLTKDEEVELAKRVEKGDKEAFDLLVLSNIRLVAHIAKGYTDLKIPYLDLVQEGTIGLITAIKKYDYRRGTKIGTVATWWIRRAISRYVMENNNTIRLPASAVEELGKVRRAQYDLIQANGSADPDEIANITGVSAKRVIELLQFVNEPLSLDYAIEEESNVSFINLLADQKNLTPDQSVNRKYIFKEIKEALSVLNETEDMVIRMRYGLLDGKVKTLEETGLAVGLCRVQVRQTQAKALYKMKNYLRTKHGEHSLH